MASPSGLSRRTFFKAGAAAGGALLIGLDRHRLLAGAAAQTDTALNAWLRIAADETVTILLSQAEMGQGVSTALPMIVAEALDADWRTVTVEIAPVDPAYRLPSFNEQTTGASLSVRDLFAPLSHAGAAARAILIAAAADHWQVSGARCSARGGRVHLSGTARSLSYGRLAAAAARQPVPAAPYRKPAHQRSLLGRSLPRLDVPAKTDGSAVFGIDLRFADMLYAAVACSPVFGGAPAKVEKDAALASPGVVAVVPVPGGVAVVADSTWRAMKGLEALAITWDDGAGAAIDDQSLTAHLEEGLNQPGALVTETGRPDQAPGERRLSATYAVPFLHHMTMEPINATARIDDRGCDLWGPTQVPEQWRDQAAALTGLPPEKVRVHVTLMGGAFGRRSRPDVAVQALTVAAAVRGRPVKLTWSREEDVQHGSYRPAVMSRLEAALDSEGWPTVLTQHISGASILEDWGVLRRDPDPMMGRGAADLPYRIANHRVRFTKRNRHVPVGVWRSVGRSHNRFFVEGFIDELAHAAAIDPYRYRRRLLQHDQRALRILDAVARRIGWGSRRKEGIHYGIAIDVGYGSVTGEAVALTVDGEKRIRIVRIVAVIDCGTVIHPDSTVAQIEGGILFGLSAALKERITLAEGRVAQSNFHDYEILTLAETPPIDVYLAPGGGAPAGVGETATPQIAPALCNAIFAATGQRIRSLPLNLHGYRLA